MIGITGVQQHSKRRIMHGETEEIPTEKQERLQTSEKRIWKGDKKRREKA